MSGGTEDPGVVVTANMGMTSFIFTLLLTRTLPVIRTTKDPDLALQLEHDLIRLTAGDEAAAITVASELVDIKTPGKFRVSGKKLHGIARHAGGDDVALCVVGAQATIQSAAQRWTLPASALLLSPIIWPKPEADAEAEVGALAGVVSRVRSAGKSSTPKDPPGVQMGDGVMQVTAGRLFHREEVAGLGHKGCSIAWVHLCLLDEVIGARTFGSPSGAFGFEGVNVGSDGTRLHVWNPASHLQLMAVEHDLAVPPFVTETMTNAAAMHVDRVKLRDAVRSVTVHLASEAPGVTLSLAAGKLVVSAKDGQGHTGREELDVVWAHAETTADFRSTEMLAMLAAHTGASCVFQLAADVNQAKPSWRLVGEGRYSVLRQS